MKKNRLYAYKNFKKKFLSTKSIHGPKFVDNARFKDIRQTIDLKNAVKGDCNNMLIYRSMHKNQIKCYIVSDCYKYCVFL